MILCVVVFKRLSPTATSSEHGEIGVRCEWIFT